MGLIVIRPVEAFTVQAFALVVYGIPVPQGSMKSMVRPHPYERNPNGLCRGGNRHVATTSDNPDLAAWRERVKLEATFVRRRATPQHVTIDAPAALYATFYLPRPKSLPKRIEYPMTKPDLDKLTRAISDSLKDAGVVAEDSRFVDNCTFKRYAIDRPCVAIGVFTQ
jgi:Holliday junction resolvase RusA-like endonuclease